MSDEPVQIGVQILDKEYRIACPPNKQEELRASAMLLDERMREIRRFGRVIGTDRIAVMAALNITHDLIEMQRSKQLPVTSNDVKQRLEDLQTQIAAALNYGKNDEDTESPEETAPQLDASGETV